MRHIAIALLCIYALPSPALADARSSFTALNNCLLKSPPTTCRSMLTTSSLPLFDRISGYDVMGCLPTQTSYVSEQTQGNYTLVRAKTQLGETPRMLRLAFLKDKAGLKLDIPYSLKLAIGENWEKQVNAVEAVYLMLKAQLGGKLNCQTVQGLAGGKQQ